MSHECHPNVTDNGDSESLPYEDMRIYINWLKDSFDMVDPHIPGSYERFLNLRPNGTQREAEPTAPSLTPQQITAVYWLAQGLTQGETAQRIGVCRHTVLRWNQQPEFREEVEALAREIAESQIHVVNNLRNRTLRALSDELLDGRTRGWAALNLLRMFGPEQLLEPTFVPSPPIITAIQTEGGVQQNEN